MPCCGRFKPQTLWEFTPYWSMPNIIMQHCPTSTLTLSLHPAIRFIF